MSAIELQPDNILQTIRNHFSTVEEFRANNKQREIVDTLMTGFACMYFQCNSVLNFKNNAGTHASKANLKTIFKISNIPADSSITRILDGLECNKSFREIFKSLRISLDRAKLLEQYKFLDKYYLTVIDGTQYYKSDKISCSGCLSRGVKKKYFCHQSLQGVVVHPDVKYLIPTHPEEICMQDGGTKEDSEISAFKRYLSKLNADHPRCKMVISGDALYACNTVIDEVNSYGYKYLFTVKSSANSKSSKSEDRLYTSVNESIKDDLLNKTYVNYNSKETGFVRWVNDIELFKGTGRRCNYLAVFKNVRQRDGSYKSSLVNRHITDIEINESNVEMLAKGARSRWKIENEGFNVLKNHGYNMEHNFGHGSRASFIYYRLVILAFYMHQIHNLASKLYKSLRYDHCKSLKTLWSKIRNLFEMFAYKKLFSIWESAKRHLLGTETPQSPP